MLERVISSLRRSWTTALATFVVAISFAVALPGAAPAATWSPCMYELLQMDCATYDFPIDRTGVVAGNTKVRAIRLAASEGPRMGTLFVIAGGPGQPSNVMLEFVQSLFVGANRYDVVAIDQRGTGFSEPLDCPRVELGNFEFDGNDPSKDKPITSCAEALGTARAGYDTVESIADMEDIRTDLGVAQVSLFGVSYGTKVALAYAGLHPANVKSLMIDSVLPVDQPGTFDTVSLQAMQKSLDELCTGGACKGVIKSPVSKLAKLARLLDLNPIDTFLIDENGKEQPEKLNAEALYDIEFAADFNLFIYNQLPMAIDTALDGNPAGLMRLFAIVNGAEGAAAKQKAAKKFRGYAPAKRPARTQPKPGDTVRGRAFIDVASFSNTLNLATSCEDFSGPWGRGAPLAGRQAAIDAAANAMPDSAFYPFPRKTVRNESLATICRGYPESPDVPALPTGPMPAVPTLALDGSLDVRTPVAWAEQAIAGNPNATLAVIPHTGHSTIGTDVSGCALDLAKRFLIYGGTDGKCRQKPKPVPVGPRAVSSVKQVKSLPGNCRGLRGRKCVSAKKSITAGYQAMRDALDQYVVGGMYQGPGLYGGGWFLESDIGDDLFTEIPVAIEAEGISQVPDVIADGRINIEEYPKVSGHFDVLDFNGDSYRVNINGRVAYDQRGDRITLSAGSRKHRITLRRRGKAGISSARVTKQNLTARSNYQRATMLSRGIR
jgi:pimeloyl-ACP methyl ester carboxylesterase